MPFFVEKPRGFEPSVSEEAESQGAIAAYERRDMPVTCLSEEGPFKRNFIDIVSRGRIPLSPFNKEGTARCLFC